MLPMSSASRVKGNEDGTKTTPLDSVQLIEEMPSTTIQSVPVIRAQAIDKREAEDASNAPTQPSSKKRSQAWS